jgi:CDP-glucose 4,6-dehydratase
MLDVYRGKKVFVTGHTGFKGSWLCEWLLALGAEVSGYSHGYPSEPCHFKHLDLEARITHHIGDIRDAGALYDAVAAFEPHFLFHLAAQPIVSEALKDPLETLSSNIMGTAHVMEVLRSVDSLRTAVIITSDKCYENVEWDYGYRESDALGGKDPYSASKAAAEIVFGSYFRSFLAAQKRIHVASARAGNVIGGGDWAKDRLIPDCIRAWACGEKPFIRNLDATRPWQHVLEPLRAYLHLGAQLDARRPGLNGEAFNFGPASSQNHSVRDVLESIKVCWPTVAWECKEDPLVKKECGLLKLNCDKSLSRLGWAPALDFDDSIVMTIDWYRAFYAKRNVQELTQGQIEAYTRQLSGYSAQAPGSGASSLA